MNHLDAQEILALLVIFGMVWQITKNIIRASDMLKNHESRIHVIERKVGIADAEL